MEEDGLYWGRGFKENEEGLEELLRGMGNRPDEKNALGLPSSCGYL